MHARIYAKNSLIVNLGSTAQNQIHVELYIYLLTPCNAKVGPEKSLIISSKCVGGPRVIYFP